MSLHTDGELVAQLAEISGGGIGHSSGPGDVPHLPAFEEDRDRFAAWLASFEHSAMKARRSGSSDAEKVALCVKALRKLDSLSKEDTARAGYRSYSVLRCWDQADSAHAEQNPARPNERRSAEGGSIITSTALPPLGLAIPTRVGSSSHASADG